MKFETQSIHAGQESNPSTGAVMTPIYQTSTYKQDGIGRHRAYDYSRTGNPIRSVLERYIATLENGVLGLAFFSGMAATDAVLRLLEPGDHVLAGNDVYGGTYRLFDKEFRRYGLEFTYVDTTNLSEVKGGVAFQYTVVLVGKPHKPPSKRNGHSHGCRYHS